MARALLLLLFAAGSIQAERLTIPGAVREALTANPELKARAMDLDLAGTDLIAARQHPNPVLSLGADHLDFLGTGYDEENAAGPPEYSARFDFLLETGGKRPRRQRVARAHVETVRADLARDSRDLALEVIEICLDVLEASIAARLARRSLDLAEAHPDEIEESPEGDLEAARIAALISRVHTASLEWWSQDRRARRELQVALGRVIDEDLPEVTGWPRRPETEESLETLITEAKRTSKDLAALRAELARSRRNEELQESRASVDPAVGSEYRRQEGLAGRGNSLGFFLSVPLPVSDRNEGERERARVETRQIATRLEARERQVAGEVAALHEELAGASAVIARLEQESLPHVAVLESVAGDPSLSALDHADALVSAHDLSMAYLEARIRLARLCYRMEHLVGRPPGAEASGAPGAPVAEPLEGLLAPVDRSLASTPRDLETPLTRMKARRKPGRGGARRKRVDPVGPATRRPRDTSPGPGAGRPRPGRPGSRY